MANKVNIKFVAILSTSLVVLAFGSAFVYWKLFTRSGEDHARIGDQKLAEGMPREAIRSYSKAVADDRSRVDWIEKWLAAVEALEPATETEYNNAFFTEYLPIVRTLAHTKGADPDAHERYLDIRMDLFLSTGSYDRAATEGLISEIETSLGFFGSLPEDDDAVRRIRKYRGLVNARIYSEGGTLERGIEEQTIEDLEGALLATPSDNEPAMALAQMLRYKADESVEADRFENARRYLTEAREALEAHRLNNPGRPGPLLLLLQQDVADLRAQRRETISRGRTSLENPYLALEPELEEIVEAFRDTEFGRAFEINVGRFQLLEGLIDPPSLLSRTHALIKRACEAEPERARWIFQLASIQNIRGENQLVLDRIAEIETLDRAPISLEGVQQHQILIQARELATRSLLTMASQEEENRDALMERARASRDEFADLVSEDDARIFLIDGMVAMLEERTEDAFKSFKRHNTLTSDRSFEGLLFEGQTALDQGFLGVAQQRLTQAIELRPSSIRASMLLGLTYSRLSDFDNAKEVFNAILAKDPGNSNARQNLDRILAQTGESSAGDPVLDLLLESRRLRAGDNENPGDPAGAVRLLSSRIEGLNHDPRLVIELAGMLLDQGDISEAREVVERGAQRNPESESMAGLAEALSSDDPTQIAIAVIDLRDSPEIEKMLAKRDVMAQNGRADEASAFLAQAAQIDAEHPRVLELEFSNALIAGDEPEQLRLTGIAERVNADQADGVTFRARMLAAKGDNTEAAALLRQAIDAGLVNMAATRLLARQLLLSGRGADAIESYEQARSIRPDDVSLIVEYLAALRRLGQNETALERARELERFGRRSPAFVNLWLALEAIAGGPSGMSFAIDRRERILELSPDDIQNARALIGLYTLGKRFDEARPLLDRLRAENDSLELVEQDARWHAEQALINTARGPISGVEMARGVYLEYLLGLDEDETNPVYLSLARFMAGLGRLDIAVGALEDAVATQDPETREADILLAGLYRQAGRFEDSLALDQSLIEGGFDNEIDGIRQRAVNTLVQLKRFEDAARMIAPIEDRASEIVRIRLQQIDISRGMGDTARSSELIELAVREHPANFSVYLQRALVNSDQADLRDDVLGDLEQANRLSPNNPAVLLTRAAYLRSIGRTEDAIDDAISVIKAEPNRTDLLLTIASELIDLGRDGEAQSLAEDVLEARFGDVRLTAQLALLFQQRERYRRSATFYKLAWDRSATDEFGYSYIDMLLRQSPPRTTQARDAYNILIDRGADQRADPKVMALRAIIEYASGRTDSAVTRMSQAFDAAVEFGEGKVFEWSAAVNRMFREHPESVQNDFLASLLSTKSPGTAAREWLELVFAQREATGPEGDRLAIARLRPLLTTETDPVLRRLAHQITGELQYANGRGEQAIATWRDGIAQFGTDWRMLNNLAYVIAETGGELGEARTYIDRAELAAPNSSSVLDTKAFLLIESGEFSEASEVIEDALEMGGMSIDARIQFLIRQAKVRAKLGSVEEATLSLAMARANAELSEARKAKFGPDIDAVQREIDSAD